MRVYATFFGAVCLLSACGGASNDASPSGASTTGGGGAATGSASTTASTSSPTTTAGDVTGSTTGVDGSTGPSDSLCGNVELASTKTIPTGATLSVCAGTTVTMAAGASITVGGTLLIQGTEASPVKFVGATAAAGSWPGVVVTAGGTLNATYLEIHAADLGIDAQASSSFQIDHLLVDTTTQGLHLVANGTVSHAVLHGLGDAQPGPELVVDNASPHIEDTLVNQGAYGGADLVIVNGATAGPVFDHVEVADAHCAFHANQGSGITISNSYVHHNLYGIMAIETMGTVISHSNFQDNTINVGSCATTATGQLTADYFEGQPADGSCMQFGVVGTTAAAYTADVGPRP